MVSMLNTTATTNQVDLDKLKKEVNKTVEDIAKSSKMLTTYKETAERDAKSVKQALNESTQAQADAKKAEGISNFVSSEMKILLHFL